jgi:iron complex outermembrane receptor protein
MKRRRLTRLLSASGLVVPLLLGSSPPVVAQAQSAQPQTEEKKPQTAKEKAEAEAAKKAEKEGVVRLAEEVSVTGSLIPREDIEALSPVAVVPPEEVTYTGTGRIEDLIQALPQVWVTQNSTLSNGASGTANVQLRHLGSVRTLALLNGRRMGSGDTYEEGADLNFIPTSLVKRVDVLTGGASSAYGADAVAGVVNFVLDTEFEGFRGEVSYNGFQHNNNNALAQQINAARGYTAPTGSTWNHGGVNFDLAVGGKFGGDKGHAMGFVDYRDVGAIWKSARDYTNCSVGSLGSTGPQCSGSATWQYGYFSSNYGDYVLDPSTGNTNTFRDRQSTDVFNYASYNFMQRNDQKWSGGAFLHYTVSPSFEPYAEVQFMNDISDAQIAPSGDFFSTSTINCDNPMMSPQQHADICGTQTSGMTDLYIARRNVEGGNRTDHLTHTNWRMLAGVRGDINRAWHYDVYGLNAQLTAPEAYQNDLSVSRMQDALTVVGDRNDPNTWQCASGNANCVPWNIFTVGGVTRAATDYIATPLIYDSGTATRYLVANLRGDLESAGVKFPSATEGVQLAVGAWVSKNSMFFNPDDNYRTANASGQGGPRLPIDGYYTTKEVFGEVHVPVVQDTVGAQDLGVELGYRFIDYHAQDQSARRNSSYKLMGYWAPVAGFRFRGGYSRAVRAPSVRELFQPQGLNLDGTEDICAGPNPAVSFEQCQRTGVTAAQYGHIMENPAQQYNGYGGGNPTLDVEKANTMTFGFVWTPKSITGLSVTADYYDIHVLNTIRAIQPDDTIRACANTGDAALCDLIHRDVRGTLWLVQNYPNGGYTIDTNQNIGDLYARGLDFSLNYPLNLGDHGYINFALMGSSVLEDRLTTPLINYDCAGYFGNQCGQPDAKWRHRLRASWNTNFKTTVSLNWRFISHVTNDDGSPEPDLGNPGLVPTWKVNGSYENPAYNYIDLAVGYRFQDNLRLTLGCNNLLDKEPPLGSGLSDTDYAAGMYGYYDSMGRALYANFQFEF